MLDGYPGWVTSADSKLYFTHHAPIDWSRYPYDYVPPITYTLNELSPDGTLRAIAEKIDDFGQLEVSGGWAYYAEIGRAHV